MDLLAQVAHETIPKAAGAGVSLIHESRRIDEYEVEAYLTGIMQLPQSECNLLALAVNELIDELPPRRRAPFSDDLRKAHTGAREIGKA